MSDCERCGQTEGYGCSCEAWELEEFWRGKALHLRAEKAELVAALSVVVSNLEVGDRNGDFFADLSQREIDAIASLLKRMESDDG